MVKCADCGFLAVRNTETRELIEAEPDYRERVSIPNVGRGHLHHELKPLCFRRSYDLRAEYTNTVGKKTSFSVCVHDIINDERECGKFTKWQQGFTPKEHSEMLDRQWQLEYERKTKRDDRTWRIWELVALIITGAIIAIVAALIGQGSIP